MGEPLYSLAYEGGKAQSPFIVCAMFTPNYLTLAQRLLSSLELLGLQYGLFKVSAVHRSISARGQGDLSVSKPRFIRFVMQRYNKPVLYVDCDVVFRKEPIEIAHLVSKECDFAVYNWLGDMMNDAWRPEPGTPLWKFFFQVDLVSDTQLMASGAVQLWCGSEFAVALLSDWEQSLRNHPRSEDDQCLDFAYNHANHAGLKPHWLTKAYCRYAYWPYVEPVIDHPQFPAPASDQFHQLGSERFDRAQLKRVDKHQPFPRDAVVNTDSRRLLRQEPDGSYADLGPLTYRFFLPQTSAVGEP